MHCAPKQKRTSEKWSVLPEITMATPRWWWRTKEFFFFKKKRPPPNRIKRPLGSFRFPTTSFFNWILLIFTAMERFHSIGGFWRFADSASSLLAVWKVKGGGHMVRPLTPHIRATSSRVTTANGCCLCFVFFFVPGWAAGGGGSWLKAVESCGG